MTELFGGRRAVGAGVVSARITRRALQALAIFVASCFASPAFTHPDLNQDGTVDVLDVQRLVNVLLSLTPPAPGGFGDVNGDGLIDVVDLQALVNICLGVAGASGPPEIIGRAELPTGLLGQPYYHSVPAVGPPPLAFSIVDPLPQGLILLSSGLIRGTPQASGLFTFAVSVFSAGHAPTTRQLSIRIEVLNVPPVASDDSYSVGLGGLLTVAAPGVLQNDSDGNNDPLTASVESPPTAGNLTLNPDGSFTYQAPLQQGTFAFSYRATDPSMTYSVATVTIGVGNLPPVAVPDSYSVPSGQTLTVHAPGILANDTDPENQPLTAELLSPTLQGVLVLHPTGAFEYTPFSGFFGMDSFEYRAHDGAGGVSDPTTVSITVTTTFAPSHLSVEVLVLGNPVKMNEAITVIARVTDGLNGLPTLNNVSTVQFTGTPIGQAPTVPLAFHSTVNTFTGEYRVTISALSGGGGVQTLFLTVTNAQQISVVKRFTVMVYTGNKIHVGHSRSNTTIADGLGQAIAGDAVLVDPGFYSGQGNHSLAIPTGVLLAGAEGARKSIVDGLSTPMIIGSGGTTRNTVTMGLTLKGASDCAFVTTGSPTLYQCIVHNNHTDGGSGAGFRVSSTGAAPLILECSFLNNRSGVLDMQWLNALGGAVYVSNSATIEVEDSLFLQNRTFNLSSSYGGAIYVDGAGPLAKVSRSRFVQNISRAGNIAYGGGISVRGARVMEVAHCEFSLNEALAIGVPANPIMEFPGTTGGRSHGGGICSGAMTGTGSDVRVASCVFDRNLSHALSWAYGGGAAALQSSSLSINHCDFDENRTVSDSWAHGGALSGYQYCWLRVESSRLQGNYTDCSSWNFGGGIHAQGDSRVWLLNCDLIGNLTPEYGGGVCLRSGGFLVAEQCRFIENRCTRGSGRTMGGAISLQASGFVVEHCQFIANQVGGPGIGSMGGGAIDIGGSASEAAPVGAKLRIANCLFDSNLSATRGAALKVGGNVAPTELPTIEMVNCTVVGNQNYAWSSTASTNHGIFMGMIRLSLRDSIIWNNTAALVFESAQPPIGHTHVATNCCIQSNHGLAGSHVLAPIAGAPLFATGVQGNYYLNQSWAGVNAASISSSDPLITGLTTNTTESPDLGQADIGWHYWPLLLPRAPRCAWHPGTLAQQFPAGSSSSTTPNPPVLLTAPPLP